MKDGKVGEKNIIKWLTTVFKYDIISIERLWGCAVWYNCIEKEDLNCDCGGNCCIYFDRDCEELQEHGLIPLCASWERQDCRNLYFEEVSNDTE